jgi:hypothetical protein
VKVGKMYVARDPRIAIEGYPTVEGALGADIANPREWRAQYSDLTVPLVGPYLVIEREGRAARLLGSNSCAWIIGQKFNGLLKELETGDV